MAAEPIVPVESPSADAQAEAILADMGIGRDDGEPIEATNDAPEPAAEAAATEAAPEAGKTAEAAPPPAPEEWTKTPEGIATKQKEVEDQLVLLSKEKTEFQRRYDQLEQRSNKLRTQVERFKKERGDQRTLHDWLSTNLNALRNGDAATRMQALGALTGKSGQEAYEDLTLGIVSNGANAKGPPPEVATLQNEVAQLKQFIAQQQQQRQTSEQAQYIQRWRENVVKLSVSPETPRASRLAEADPEDYANQAQEIAEMFHARNGRPIAPGDIPKLIESRLSRVVPSMDHAQPSGEVAAPSDGGTSPAIVAQAKPGTAQRPPKGTSIPQAAGSAARTRELTESERLKKAAELVPEYALRYAER